MKFHYRSFRCGVLAAVLSVSFTAHVADAAITVVTDSRVSGYFGTGCAGVPASGCTFQLSDPAQAWGPAAPLPPAGGNPVATPSVPFTYPNPRYYSATDNAGTSTGTAIVGGFVVGAAGNNDNTAFIRVPQNSYLIQQNFVPLGDAAFTQLNFSMDYGVDNGGLNGGFQTANYQVFGNVSAGGYAKFDASMTYWDVTNGVAAAVDLGSLNLSFLQDNTLGPLSVAFNQQLLDVKAIKGMGAGTMRVTGSLRWEGDPSSITISDNQATVPLPAAVWLFGSGLAGLIGFARRKARPV